MDVASGLLTWAVWLPVFDVGRDEPPPAVGLLCGGRRPTLQRPAMDFLRLLAGDRWSHPATIGLDVTRLQGFRIWAATTDPLAIRSRSALMKRDDDIVVGDTSDELRADIEVLLRLSSAPTMLLSKRVSASIDPRTRTRLPRCFAGTPAVLRARMMSRSSHHSRLCAPSPSGRRTAGRGAGRLRLPAGGPDAGTREAPRSSSDGRARLPGDRAGVSTLGEAPPP